MKQQIIKQDNSITNARYDFTACQLDILFSVMSKIHDEDASNKIYEVMAAEIEKLTGRKWNYQQFKDATESMGSRMFEIQTEKKYRQFWLFQHVDYITGQGRIEIKFSEDAIMLLKQLKNNFTTYELHAALKMKSKYAKRIYQICSQWKDIGESKAMLLIDFKKNLGLVDNKGVEQFTSISMFKSRVLEVAVRQINEYSDLDVSYTMHGDSEKKKQIKYITFYIKHKQHIMLPIKFDDTVVDTRQANLLSILFNLGIKSKKYIADIQKNEAMIQEVFSFNYQLQTGKIKADKNAGGLLLKKLGLV
ncbi:replication initiation protein [Runella limosa]|uniref:replication initiation protein n=1 Tax=Runella limosa TaxID=370978 RepID=UPI000403486E|nr:replication initiation protein [Runella limosa]